MPLFTLGETVTYNGHKMTVETVRKKGESADLVCEIIPFLPTRFFDVSNTEVQR